MLHSTPSSAARRLLHTSAFLLLPLAAAAQSVAKPGYVLDRKGDFLRNSTPGQCWHDGQWTPAMAQESCDPVPKVAVAAPHAPVKEAAQEPRPVAVAPKSLPVPAPEVAAVIAPAPAPVLRYAADALFDFDKSSLRPKGKEMLNEAGANILGLKGEKIEVVGHADRLGTIAYNQKLSLQRAESVRDYLVTRGVAVDRIVTRGLGESEPVTLTGSCTKGSKAMVIACLQPDRRVDITIQGTKIATP
jgi:OOP family OmpA-OmpF porin